MQSGQRVVLLWVIIGLVLTGGCITYQKQKERRQGQWEAVQTERFIKKICKSGMLSLQEYMLYCNMWVSDGSSYEIKIEEYRKEQDIQGRCYYYLVTWEELKNTFRREEFCTFEEESVIRMEVRKQGCVERINEYYGIVSGEES